MKRFFIKTTIFSFLIVLIVTLILFLPPTNFLKESTNLFALVDKNNLMRNVKSPRIIFIGGSNISFSLNSQMIKDSLRINPINTGIHASIGLKFMLRNSLHFIKENDIVVISPEYHQFYGSLADGDIVLLSILIDVLPQFEDTDFKQLLGLSKYIPEYAVSKLKIWQYFKKGDTTKLNDVGRYSFNKYGDAYIHWTMKRPENFVSYDIGGEFNDEIINLLHYYNKELQLKKAKLFITFPAFEEKCFNRNISYIKKIENKLIQNDFHVIGIPERYKMNDSVIFKTAYHLTKKGVDYRTSLLIDDIKKQLCLTAGHSQ